MVKKALLILVLAVAAACGREVPFGFGKKTEPPKPAGSPIGDYKAKWLDGSTFDLAKERGNVVFLNVWATWCGPCRYEIPELDKLHAKYASRGFKVVGVSVDEGGIPEVKPFVEEQKIGYPIVIDPLFATGVAARTAFRSKFANVPPSAAIESSAR